MLRVGDVRLKNLPRGAICGPLSDLSSLDDARHLFMQCPALQSKRNSMFNEIRDIHDGAGGLFLGSGCEILKVLLAKIYDGIYFKGMGAIWRIAAKYFNLMYYSNMTLKEGFG